MAINTGTAVGYTPLNITGDATTLVRTGGGILHTLTFNNPTATETVTIYDGLTAGGTKLATITVPSGAVPVSLLYDLSYVVGLTIVTGTATGDITVTFI
jgi:hypothetical protein